jgi:hypothetical protein
MKQRTTSTEKFIKGNFSPELLIAADQLVLDALSNQSIASDHRSLTDELIQAQ